MSWLCSRHEIMHVSSSEPNEVPPSVVVDALCIMPAVLPCAGRASFETQCSVWGTQLSGSNPKEMLRVQW
jgi:hypothetical protein